MNQIKIGRFIAENRKQKNLTQEELGEKLGVTNKTVSRWETGMYMPDLDTIQLLCDELDITVNELLSGERLGEDYKDKADENVMDVFAVNKSVNKQRLIYDILTGAGTGIILGVVYAPDSTKKAICVGFGMALLCIGWFLKSKLDRTVIGR